MKLSSKSSSWEFGFDDVDIVVAVLIGEGCLLSSVNSPDNKSGVAVLVGLVVSFVVVGGDDFRAGELLLYDTVVLPPLLLVPPPIKSKRSSIWGCCWREGDGCVIRLDWLEGAGEED